jgi:phenylacetaldehyde dehydrogenase
MTVINDPAAPINLLGAAARAFLDDLPELFYGGQFRTSVDGEPMDLYDPGAGIPFAQYVMAGPEDMRAAITAAHDAFAPTAPWRTMSAAARSRLMYRLADAMDECRDELAELESFDGGKPLAVAAGFDVEYAIRHMRYYAGWPTKIEGNTIPVDVAGMMVRTERVPVGVVSQIIPWNFPILMAAWKLAPALAAGCTVVLKPAEQTVVTALRLARLVADVGFPPGVVNIVPARGARVGSVMVEDPRVHKIAFTGSTLVGQEIARRAANGIKRLTLELGGKSANVICADARLEDAIPGAAAAIFANAGQVCSAGSRLFVAREVFDDVMSGLAEHAAGMTMAHQLEPGCDIGPLISDVQLSRVNHHLDKALGDGATVAFGGAIRPNATNGYFVEPTALVDVTDDMDVVQQEIFGPVVVALPFDDIHEVADRANDSPYGLAAGVWSRDIGVANVLASSMRAGSVYVNTYGQSDAAAPFGGFGLSGYGREMGHANLDAYLETRTIWTNLAL